MLMLDQAHAGCFRLLQLVPYCIDRSTQGWEEGAGYGSYMVVLKAPRSTQVPACALLRDGVQKHKLVEEA